MGNSNSGWSGGLICCGPKGQKPPVNGAAVVKSCPADTVDALATKEADEEAPCEAVNWQYLFSDEGRRPICEQTPLSLSLQASATVVSEGCWRVDGVTDEQALKAGLLRLDEELDEERLLTFPQKENGRGLLLSEKMIKDLLSKTRDFQSVSRGDLAAAQQDLKRLTLRQLVRLRKLTADLSFASTWQADFLFVLDGLIFEGLGRKAIGQCRYLLTEVAADRESAVLKRLGRELVTIVGAAWALPQPPCWVCWVAKKQLFFHAESFACTDMFPGDDGGALEFEDQSEIDSIQISPKRYNLIWYVRLCTKRSGLKTKRVGRPSVLGRPSVYGETS